MIKKIYLLVIAFLLAVLPLTVSPIYAENSNQEEVQNSLSTTIDEQLANLDLDGLNNFFNNFCDDKLGVFEGKTILEKIKEIINGNFSNDTSSILGAIANVFFEEIISFLPLISSIIAVAVLASIITELNNNKSTSNVVHFVCFGVVVILVLGTIIKLVAIVSSTLTLLNSQMEIVFPILLTLLTALGGTVSVAVYQPAVAVLTTGISNIFINVMMPLFIFSLVLSIISHLSPSIKLNKLSSFCITFFKWLIGIVFTVFMGFLAIKGITAGSIDSVSFKTARYSLSNYVPIVGGYLSEGLNLILASCLLIKNAIGLCGLLIMLSSIIAPVVSIIIFILLMKFIGAVLEPLSDGRISNFISSIGKIFIMPIAMILAVAFMYTIFIGILMGTSIGM